MIFKTHFIEATFFLQHTHISTCFYSVLVVINVNDEDDEKCFVEVGRYNNSFNRE